MVMDRSKEIKQIEDPLSSGKLDGDFDAFDANVWHQAPDPACAHVFVRIVMLPAVKMRTARK